MSLIFDLESVSKPGCTSVSDSCQDDPPPPPPRPSPDCLKSVARRCRHFARIAHGRVLAKLTRTFRRCSDTLGPKCGFSLKQLDEGSSRFLGRPLNTGSSQ